jgi:hypothetical protein
MYGAILEEVSHDFRKKDHDNYIEGASREYESS